MWSTVSWEVEQIAWWTPTAEGVIYPSGGLDFQWYLDALSTKLKTLEMEAKQSVEWINNKLKKDKSEGSEVSSYSRPDFKQATDKQTAMNEVVPAYSSSLCALYR